MKDHKIHVHVLIVYTTGVESYIDGIYRYRLDAMIRAKRKGYINYAIIEKSVRGLNYTKVIVEEKEVGNFYAGVAL